MLSKLKNFILNLFPEPSDIYEAIRPLYVYSKLMGLACYTTTTTGNVKRYGVTPFAMLQQIFTVFIVTGLCAYYFFTQTNIFFGNDIMVKLQCFQDMIANLLMTTEMIFVTVFAKKIVQVFKNIDEVDKWFKNLGLSLSYKCAYIISISIIVSGVVLLITVVATTLSVIGIEQGIVQSIFYIAVNFCPYQINFVFQFQYVQYMTILTRRYKLLNTYLKTLLIREDKAKIAWVTKFDKIEAINKLGKAVYKDPVFVVDTVAAIHIKLNDTALLINHAFCVQLLLSITIAFIGLVTALFLIAVNFSRPSTNDNLTWNFMFTLWAFSTALILMSTVYVTCNLCEKANKCPKILHRIRNNSVDRELNDTIEIYSLQMYHNRLQFHVCGLFPLDYTLLYTIVAGITTYLVILIQFNNSSGSQKGNETTNATVPY